MQGIRVTAGILLSLVTLAAGCSLSPQTRQLQADRPVLPASVELVDTPFFPQEHYQCGPAALATVLAYRDIEITPGKLVDAVFLPARHGSLPDEISATARRYGMLAYPLQPRLNDLLIEIAHGNPVLIFQNQGTGWIPRWHFAVVVGYDLDTSSIILRSGRTRRWQTSFSTLERTWSRGDYWARVILPAGEIPATARLQHYLQAALDLENAGQGKAAAAAYLAATRDWPEDSRAWMALGNIRYGRGKYEPATAAFRRASSLDPDNPQTWNNLAYALLGTGCPEQAVRAAACASGLAPGDAGIQDTLTETMSHIHERDRPQCLPVACHPND